MTVLICAQILFHNLSKVISSAIALNKVIVLLLEKFIFQTELEVRALPRARGGAGDKSQEPLPLTFNSCSNLGN